MPTVKKLLPLAGLTAWAVLSAVPCVAQGFEPTGYEPNGDPYWERRNEDLPKFVVVREFFGFVESCRRTGGQTYSGLLKSLGIEEGTAAEQILLQASAEANTPQQDHWPDLRPYLENPVAFEQVQLTALHKRVHHLRSVYYGLLDDLTKEGISSLAVELVVEQKRKGMVMVSTPTPEYRVFEIMAEFEIGGRK